MHTNAISNKALKNAEAISASEILKPIFDLIKAAHPKFRKDDYLAVEELNTTAFVQQQDHIDPVAKL